MISVLVVLTGSLLGAGPWRYLNYRGANGQGYVHRAWAVPAMVLGSLLLTLFAFYIAHYRYALSHSALDAPVPDNILTSIATHPFEPFQQLESLLLFVIALLIGIFSIARGAHWDDPYPGYGPRHRRVEEARERANEIVQRLSSDIDTAKTLADEALVAVASKSTEMVGALRRAIARTQDNATTWDFTAAQVIAEGRDAIEIYREPIAPPATAGAPEYFQEDAFDGLDPPKSAEVLEQLTTAFSRATGNITACKSQIAGARAQLEAEYHSFYDDELAPFLKGIENAATIHVRGEFADVANARVDIQPPEADDEDEDDEEELETEEIAPRSALSFFSRRGARR